MEVATAKEARALTNKTKAITPGTLREVLSSYATKEYADTHGGGGGSGLVDDVKVNGTSVVDSNKVANVIVPTSLSQLTNDDHYVQTINGYVPAEYLPSYVDDVLEYQLFADLPNPGETGKIYVVLATNLTYRWTGSTYVEISQSLALGETQDTAYRGDRGKTAYDHSQIVNGNPHGLTLSTFGIAITAAEINYLSGLSENIITALNKKLNLTGGVMTGYITLHSEPALDMHAVPKQYVDKAIYSVAVVVNQNVSHYNNIIDKMNLQESQVGVHTETLVKVNNKIDGYSFVPYDSSEYTIGNTIVPTETPDMSYKEGINYYIENNGAYVPLEEGTDYNLNDKIAYNSEGNTLVLCDNVYEQSTTYAYEETAHVKYKSGTDYYKKDFTMVVSGDSVYLPNKKYYKHVDSQYVQLIPVAEYTIGAAISGTVYEISYGTTYTQLVSGTDYDVGDPIQENVYQYIQHQDYNLTTDTTWQTGKTYYYRKLTGGVDTILSSYKDSFSNISSTESEISQQVGTVQTFIDNNITNQGGLIDQINSHGGRLNQLDINVGTLFNNATTTSLAIQGLLGADATLNVNLSNIEKTTKDIQTDSYIKQEVQTIINGVGWFLTRDLTFKENREYWIKDSSHNWIRYTDYNIGDIIPENQIYEYGKTKVVASESGKFDDEGLLIAKEEVYDYTYKQTKHEKYLNGTHYYILDNGNYNQLFSMHKAITSDTHFDDTKSYYLKENDVYVLWPPTTYFLTKDTSFQEYGYNITKDTVFVANSTYYEANDNIYTELIYDSTNQTYTDSEGNVYNVNDPMPSTKLIYNRYTKEYYMLVDNLLTRVYKKEYSLTSDTTFVANKNYYISVDGSYVLYVSYTVGDTIPANTIYECTGDYDIGEEILPNTVSELQINWVDGDEIPNDLILFEEIGDYVLGSDIPVTYQLTSDTQYQSEKEYYLRSGSGTEEDPYVYILTNQYTIGDSIPSDTVYERFTTIYVEDQELTRFISDTIGRYNEQGMRIRKVSNQYNEAANEEILYAGVDENDSNKSVVRTINLEAKEYLYAANKHMRIEQFTVNNNPGWGMFYL